MNLQTLISPELWLAVSNTYQAENYGHAILDAMHYLSDVLREKTGLDGDGHDLVNKALSGDSPRLRINKLQTQTERDEQTGIKLILLGLYSAIRNPRSHAQVQDNKDTADAIIFFINYLLAILAESQEPFTIEGFLERVFDPYFVELDRYAELLAAEIPPNKRLDTLIEIFRRKADGNGDKLGYIIEAILAQLSDDQIGDFISVVSDELKTTSIERNIRLSLQILPPQMWTRINEIVRLRIENKLISSIKEGEVWPDGRIKGPLGTWARDYLEYFILKEEVGRILIAKLQDEDVDDRTYVANYFLGELPDVIVADYQVKLCIGAISKAIRSGDSNMKQRLVACIWEFPDEWQKQFAESLSDLTDPDKPETYLMGGTPFLGKAAEYPAEPEDLPF
jgi:uncharacterized protein (TIGR02391 family)